MQQQSFDNFDLSLTLCFSLVKCLTSAVLGDATLLATTAIRYPQPRAPRHAVPLAQPCPVAGWPRPVGTRALFKFVERGLASRSAATVNSVTPGVAMLCHQRVDDAWRALWPLNVTHARAARAAPCPVGRSAPVVPRPPAQRYTAGAFTNAVEVKGGPRR